MKYTIRPVRLPDDYAAMAEILNLIRPGSASAEGLESEDREIPPENRLRLDEHGTLVGFGRERVVAEDESGNVVAYAITWRAPWGVPGKLGSHLCVRPEFRRQGIGSALVAHLERWAQEQHAGWLQSEINDRFPESLPFAERRGFVVNGHLIDSLLDLSQFDATRFAGRVDRVRAGGIRLLTLADVPGEDSERKLYDLYRETLTDNPGFMGYLPVFKRWHNEALDDSRTRPEWVWIAADGDRFVGVTTLFTTDAPDTLYTDYTGVLREYRGRGIALALKLLAVEAAIATGARRMTTDNEERNGPMLAVNRKLGYMPTGTGNRVVSKRM